MREKKKKGKKVFSLRLLSFGNEYFTHDNENVRRKIQAGDMTETNMMNRNPNNVNVLCKKER